MRGKPGYLLLAQTGELKKRADDAREFLKNCRLCPQLCGINRTVGEKGICRAGDSILVSSVTPHFGEEKVLVGKKGSGTIFFGLCNLKCVFCQNYELSHFGEGHKITVEQFADAMLQLQDLGCHNINFVSPTHFAAQIVQNPEGINGCCKAGRRSRIDSDHILSPAVLKRKFLAFSFIVFYMMGLVMVLIINRYSFLTLSYF
jgi:uncharacterized Fe-S radical SAM superfamily protein PflX